MSRKHLFVIVVLLGAAAVAGMLALTRTTTAATRASSMDIAAKSRSLDQLEASLRRALAQQPPALPTPPSTGDSSTPPTIYVPSTAPQLDHEDDDESRDDEHADEDEHEDEDADD
jgi:hypothetical protein